MVLINVAKHTLFFTKNTKYTTVLPDYSANWGCYWPLVPNDSFCCWKSAEYYGSLLWRTKYLATPTHGY